MTEDIELWFVIFALRLFFAEAFDIAYALKSRIVGKDNVRIARQDHIKVAKIDISVDDIPGGFSRFAEEGFAACDDIRLGRSALAVFIDVIYPHSRSGAPVGVGVAVGGGDAYVVYRHAAVLSDD